VPSPPDLPGWAELTARLHVVRVPLTMPFRGVIEREAALVQGPAGWGEFAPFVEYGDAESARWLAAAVEAAWTGWPAPRRDAVPVNATVPAVPARAVPGVLARFPGCTTAKVKVAQAGQGLADDVARVAAVRDVLGPGGRIRVDANGGWTVPAAVDALTALASYGLEYAEQPCATVPELAALRRQLAGTIPVAADESVRKAADPERVALAGAADLVVLKVAPMGGVRPAVRVAAACGLPVVVSSALDTSVGIAAGAALAAALPDLPYACGLGTVGLIQVAIIAASGVLAGAATGTLHLHVGSAAGTIIWLVVWFLLGYTAYAFAFAAVASLVSRQEEVASAVTPVMMLLIVGYVIGISILPSNPGSGLVAVLSLIPVFAPTLMPVRLALGVVPAWQAVVSVAGMVVIIPLLLWLAARIYRNAVLRSGARVKLREAWRS